MHGDHPGVPHAGHAPGGERAEFAGQGHVAVVEPEGAARVADVQFGGEPDLVAGLQAAVGDAFETAYDGVGGAVGPGEDLADDRVHALADEAVGARAEGGQGAGQGDLAGGGAVHGEPWFGGQGAAGGCLECGVAGEAAGGDAGGPGEAGGEGYGDGGGRRPDSAHRSSVVAGEGFGQRNASLSGRRALAPGGGTSLRGRPAARSSPAGP